MAGPNNTLQTDGGHNCPDFNREGSRLPTAAERERYVEVEVESRHVKRND